MYGIALCHGGFIRSAEIQRALSELPFECGTELHTRRMRELSAIEHLEARGMQYSNQDFDVLSSALNFLDAVAPEVSERLRLAAPHFGVGDSVRVIGNSMTTPRRSRVVELVTGSTGKPLYRLADGGLLDSRELQRV